MATKHVKLQLLVKGVVVFEYIRGEDELDMNTVELKLVDDTRCDNHDA